MRGISTRPASTEEQECWAQAARSLKSLAALYNSPAAIETIGRVNRLISVWPVDDNLPAEGLDEVKITWKKLSAGLNEIQHTAEAEVKAVDDTIEQLGVLTAMRKASEALPLPEKRKRPRAPSPSVLPVPPMTSTPSARGVSITLPARNSVGPAAMLAHLPKHRRDAFMKQLPLQPGRQVAFLPPQKPQDLVVGKNPEATEPPDWILTVVTRAIDKNTYEIRDADEDSSEVYTTTIKNMLPLPDPNAHHASTMHLNAYGEFPTGSEVLALYPDTTSFYNATVLSTPKELREDNARNPLSTPGTKPIPTYRIQFADDDGLEHFIIAHHVVDRPLQVEAAKK